MRIKLTALGLCLSLLSPLAVAQSGVVSVPSNYSVAETIDKLDAALKAKGMTVFARIDHAAGAAKAGMELADTQLLIFGNPKAGTPLMKCSQSIAIDLPQKMLAHKDSEGKVHLSYNEPSYLKARHGTKGCDKVFEKITGVLGNFAKAATQ